MIRTTGIILFCFLLAGKTQARQEKQESAKTIFCAEAYGIRPFYLKTWENQYNTYDFDKGGGVDLVYTTGAYAFSLGLYYSTKSGNDDYDIVFGRRNYFYMELVNFPLMYRLKLNRKSTGPWGILMQTGLVFSFNSYYDSYSIYENNLYNDKPIVVYNNSPQNGFGSGCSFRLGLRLERKLSSHLKIFTAVNGEAYRQFMNDGAQRSSYPSWYNKWTPVYDHRFQVNVMLGIGFTPRPQ